MSVIVPARNAAATLGEQLAALERQTYDGAWELVVVDHQSVDETCATAEAWAARIPHLRCEPAHGGDNVSFVRNVGVRLSRGDLVALCDADDIVSPGWLAALVDVAGTADIVGGTFDVSTLNTQRSIAWRGMDPHGSPYAPFDHLPYAPGGNCAVWRDVFDAVGGWSEDYKAGSDDVDFCWRARAHGYTLAFAPEAVLQYRFRDDLSSLVRQYWRYGLSEALLYSRFRNQGPRRQHVREILGTWKLLMLRATALWGDPIQRGCYMRDVSWRAGRLLGGLRHGVLIT